MNKVILVLTLMCPCALVAIGQPTERPALPLFMQLGLTPQQVASIDQGRPVAKVLSWGKASEVYVFGAVHVNGSASTYAKAARDVNRLAGTPGYLGVGELAPTATAADLTALALDPDDVKALKSCKEGSCDVQLPATSIQAFRDEVNWSQPDAADQVNRLARTKVLDLVRAYRSGGNAALGTYRDKEHPARVAEQFAMMIGRSAALPEVIPDFRRYLLDYPAVDLPGSDNFFFWEKVDFGLKPTIRVNHAVSYKTTTKNGDADIVAIKQLYATHYFHTALDVSVCLTDTGPSPRGFYLVTLKGSDQEGLTGMKGSILRKLVVDKTRSALERALTSIKETVEQSSTPAK
jgi:hypothetical protein